MMNTLRMTLLVSALAAGSVLPVNAQPARATAPSFLAVTGDSTLERLIDAALRSGHDLQIAEARVRGARAARMHAALDLVPAITATGGYTRQRIASFAVPGAAGSRSDQDLWDAGLQLAWEVDVFGRGRRSLQGQGELVSASYENLHDVQVLLASEVADAYFELRGAQDRLWVARRNAENQRGTLEITLQRLEGGSGTALDSERARAQLSATLADIPTLEAAIAGARYRIGVLTARDPDVLAPELAAVAMQSSLPEQLSIASPDSFVRRRPDVRSAERQVAAREAFVGAAKAERHWLRIGARVSDFSISMMPLLRASGRRSWHGSVSPKVPRTFSRCSMRSDRCWKPRIAARSAERVPPRRWSRSIGRWVESGRGDGRRSSCFRLAVPGFAIQ